MMNTRENTAIAKYQSIDEVVQSLSEVSERAKKHDALAKIQPQQKLFGKTKTPTIDDINNLVNDVDGQLIDLKNFNIEILDEIRSVCMLLSAVDKKHVDELLATATAAHEASIKATKNVESINTIMLILTSLQHLGDIDQMWEEGNAHAAILSALVAYKGELSKLKHIMDVDKLWEDNRAHASSLEKQSKRISELSKALDDQAETINTMHSTLQAMVKKQESFIAATNIALSERQTAIDQHLEVWEKALQDALSNLNDQVKMNGEVLTQKASEISAEQTAALAAMKKEQAENLLQLKNTQENQLNAIQKAQENQLNAIQKAQEESLMRIADSQADTLQEIKKEQADELAQINKDQSEQFDAINKSVNEEKAALAAAVSVLTLKVKTAYIFAGGAAAVTAIHLLLSILGVI